MASEPVLVIESSPEIELTLPALGAVRVHDGGLFFHRALAWRRRRPLAANYRAFANAAMAASLDPKPSLAAIERLTERQRRTLMREVVRAHGEEKTWRQLARSFLGPDERLFAVLLWAAEREQAERARVAALLREQQQERLRDVASVAGLASSRGVPSLSETIAKAMGITDSWTRLTMAMEFYTRGPFSDPMKAAYGLDAARAGVLGTPDTSPVMRALGVRFPAVPAFDAVKLAVDVPGISTSVAHLPQVSSDLTRALARLGVISANAEQLLARTGAITADLERLRALRTTYPLPSQPWFNQLVGVSRPLGIGQPLAIADALRWPGLQSFPPSGLAALDSIHRKLGTLAVFDAVAAVQSRMSSLLGETTFSKLLETARWFEEQFAGFDDFSQQWENDPLWLVIGLLDYTAIRVLFGLARAKVEAAVFAALTEVVLEGRLIAAMRTAVEKAPGLTDFQREWLDDALAHVAAAEWVKAIPPLMAGLEGVLQTLARQRSEQLRRRRGKIIVAPKIIEVLEPDPEYFDFMRMRVFGGTGQEFRHGIADRGEREQVLLALVGLAFCLGYWLEIRAMSALGRLLSGRLAAVVSQIPN